MPNVKEALAKIRGQQPVNRNQDYINNLLGDVGYIDTSGDGNIGLLRGSSNVLAESRRLLGEERQQQQQERMAKVSAYLDNLFGEQEKYSADDAWYETGRKIAGNTVKGLGKFIPEMAAGAVVDPLGTAKGLVTFFPELAMNIDKAVSYNGVPLLRTPYAQSPAYKPEQVRQAREE